MSGENRSRLHEGNMSFFGGVEYDVDLEQEMADALRQEIDREILHDLNMLCLPNLLNKLAQLHMRNVTRHNVALNVA